MTEVHPRRATCGIPLPWTESEVLPVAVVRFARESHRVKPVPTVEADDEDRPVLAAAVGLVERDPGPDDLTRIRIAVGLGSIADAETSDVGGHHPHGPGRRGRAARRPEQTDEG